MRLFRFYGTLYVFLRTETFVLSVIALSRDANPESLFLFGLWRVLFPPLPSFGTRTLLRHSPDLCHPMADMATLSSSRSPPGADRPSHHSKSFARLMGERTCSCGKPGCLQALREYYLDPARRIPTRRTLSSSSRFETRRSNLTPRRPSIHLRKRRNSPNTQLTPARSHRRTARDGPAVSFQRIARDGTAPSYRRTALDRNALSSDRIARDGP